MRLQRYLVSMALFLTFGVIALGAFTRLSNAGLGCPDWPGCYGALVAPTSDTHITGINEDYPEATVDIRKAWIEMLHRYLAGSLGILILVIFSNAWRLSASRLKKIYAKSKKITSTSNSPIIIPLVLVILIVLQSLLGMLTVTMKLHPLVVMTHLAGGFTTLACLLYYWHQLHHDYQLDSECQGYFNHRATDKPQDTHKIRAISIAALTIVIMQILFGGWLSANYAAPFCQGLPLCQELAYQEFSLGSALQIDPHAADFEYGVLSAEARMSIHLLHRFGAIVVLSTLLTLVVMLYRQSAALLHRYAHVLILITTTQVSLGILLVLLQFPLAIALSHNLMAALLLLALVSLIFTCNHPFSLHQRPSTANKHNFSGPLHPSQFVTKNKGVT